MNFKRLVLFGVVIFSICILNPMDVYAATRYWVGGTDGANINDPANWSASDPVSCSGGGASVPVAGDDIIFDADCDNGATINANLAAKSITINNGYTGTISVEDGANVVLSGAYSQSGGTFIAGSGIFSVRGNFTHTAGGTFDASNGTVVFAGLGTTDVAVTETFNNLVFDTTVSGWSRTIASGDTLIVNGTLTLSSGYISTGTIDARGDVVVMSTFNTNNIASNNISYTFSGSSTQTISGAGTDRTFTTGQVTINNLDGVLELAENTVISRLTVADGGTFNLNGFDFTAETSFIVEGGGKLVLFGNETVTNPILSTNSTVEYSGSSNLNIKDEWVYSNLSIFGIDTPTTATFTAGSTYIIPGVTTISGFDEINLLQLRSSTNESQWSIDPQDERIITNIDVKDSVNINEISIEATGRNSGNNIKWNIASIFTGNLTASTFGLHIKSVDFDTLESIELDGGFALYRESGTDTVNEIIISQFGTLEPEYIKDVKLNYVINEGTSAHVCPSTYDEVGNFDGNFGGMQDLNSETEKATFSDTPGIEIQEGNVLCIYPEYKIDFDSMSQYDSVGKTIKLGISESADIVLEGEGKEVTLSSTPLSVGGSTILAQDGVKQIIFKDKNSNAKTFYVKDEVLYLQEGQSSRRLTSRDVAVEYANFNHIARSGSTGGQVEVTLRLKYIGPTYVGAPIVQTFKTTINSSY